MEVCTTWQQNETLLINFALGKTPPHPPHLSFWPSQNVNCSSGIFGHIDNKKTLLIMLITLSKKTIREKPNIDGSQIRYRSPTILSWSQVLSSSYTSCYERLAQRTFSNLSLSLKRWGLIIITCHIWVLYSSAVLKSKGLSGTRNDKNLLFQLLSVLTFLAFLPLCSSLLWPRPKWKN